MKISRRKLSMKGTNFPLKSNTRRSTRHCTKNSFGTPSPWTRCSVSILIILIGGAGVYLSLPYPCPTKENSSSSMTYFGELWLSPVIIVTLPYGKCNPEKQCHSWFFFLCVDKNYYLQNFYHAEWHPKIITVKFD